MSAVKGMRVRSSEKAGGRAILDGMAREGLLHTLTFKQRMRGENFGYLSGRGQRKCKGPKARFYLVCEEQWGVQAQGSRGRVIEGSVARLGRCGRGAMEASVGGLAFTVRWEARGGS